jgi:uncharacterized metal-binding protein YceD (DUF177 family)
VARSIPTTSSSAGRPPSPSTGDRPAGRPGAGRATRAGLRQVLVEEPILGTAVVLPATGTVSAPWRGACRRCAVPVDGELVIGVRERFVERPAPEDDEAYPIIDNALDLAPMARDAIVLELPMAPLCQDGCRGLCATCGADRNHEDCGCVAPRDPRWANLDVLRPAQ